MKLVLLQMSAALGDMTQRSACRVSQHLRNLFGSLLGVDLELGNCLGYRIVVVEMQ